jgi:hypothetical protein
LGEDYAEAWNRYTDILKDCNVKLKDEED